MEAVKRAVEAGLRTSVLSPSVIQREPATGILRMLPLAGRDMHRESFLIHRKEKYPFSSPTTSSLSLVLRHNGNEMCDFHAKLTA
jgi:DNA-binding transcriptional LysR family regulator